MCLQRLFAIVSLEFSANLAVIDGSFDLSDHARSKYNVSGRRQDSIRFDSTRFFRCVTMCVAQMLPAVRLGVTSLLGGTRLRPVVE